MIVRIDAISDKNYYMISFGKANVKVSKNVNDLDNLINYYKSLKEVEKVIIVE